VVELLVDHALAAFVHEDHRIACHREHARHRWVAGNGLLERDRAHPRVIHVTQLYAERTRDSNEITLIGHRRAPAVQRDRKEVLAQLWVVGEAASGEDNGLAGACSEYAAAFGPGLDTNDFAPVVQDHLLHTMAGLDVHAVTPARRRKRP